MELLLVGKAVSVHFLCFMKYSFRENGEAEKNETNVSDKGWGGELKRL